MTKQSHEISEGHPFEHLLDDQGQAERIARRVAELVREDAVLKAAREAAGIPQKDVAARLGVSRSAVSQLEARELADIHVGTLRNYFRTLGYEVELTVTPKR